MSRRSPRPCRCGTSLTAPSASPRRSAPSPASSSRTTSRRWRRCQSRRSKHGAQHSGTGYTAPRVLPHGRRSPARGGRAQCRAEGGDARRRGRARRDGRSDRGRGTARRGRREGAARQGGGAGRSALRHRLGRLARHEREQRDDDGVRHAPDGRLRLPVHRISAEGGAGARRADRHRRPDARPALSDGGQRSSATARRRCAPSSRSSRARRIAHGASRSRRRCAQSWQDARSSARCTTRTRSTRSASSGNSRRACRRTASSRRTPAPRPSGTRAICKMRRGMMASVSGTLATMGCAVPYAIAAKFAHPDRPVIACVGDGAMQMNGINELITDRQRVEAVERSAADRARPQQPRPELRHLGAARDGGQPALRGVAGRAGLPVRALRRDARPAPASASMRPTQVAGAWDAAFAADRPVADRGDRRSERARRSRRR